VLEDRLALATRVWDGGSLVNSNWSTAANWVGDVAPVPGVDDLEFPSVAARKANTNDFVNAAFLGITFTGSNYVLGGNAVTLGGDLNAGPGTFSNYFNLNLTLNANRTFQLGASSALVISGVLGGPGGFTKTGTGTLQLRGANTYAGLTQVSDGAILVEHPSALGATQRGTIIAKGAALRLINIPSPVVFPPEPLTFGPGPANLGATLGNSVSDATWTGPITLDPGENNFASDSGKTLRISGAIGGAGGFRHIASGGILELAGPAPNTYTGGTEFGRGTLRLNKQCTDCAIPGALSIGTADASAGVVIVMNHPQIVDTAPVTFVGGSGFFGTLDLNGILEAVGSVSGTGGHIRLGTSSGALLVVNNTSTTFGGDITGTGSLLKAGTGTLTLTGTSTYSGFTEVELGTLEINGSQPNSPVFVSGGTLRGVGTIGALTATRGSVDPGRGAGTGRLTVNGDVRLEQNSTLRVRLNGTTPGTEFDQLRVIGPVPRTVTLLNPRLDATIAFNAVGGTRLSIIDNTTDGDAPTGAFQGAPQGQLFTIAGALGAPDQAFRTDYTGGNFNDVDLIRNTPPMVEYIFLDPEEIAAGESTYLVGQLTDPDPDDYQGLYISWGDGSEDQVEYPGLEPFVFQHQYDDPGEYEVFAFWFDPSGEGNFRILPLTVLPTGAPGETGGRPATSAPSARGVDDPRSLLRGSPGGPAQARPEQQTSHATDGAFGWGAGAGMARLDVLRRLPVQITPLAGGILISPDPGAASHEGADSWSRPWPAAPVAGAIPDGLFGPQDTVARALAVYSPEGALPDELAMRLLG
jgi:autotransporter-associated beta strand protein